MHLSRFTIRRSMIAIAIVVLLLGVSIALRRGVWSELSQLAAMAFGVFTFLFSIILLFSSLMIGLAFRKTDRSHRLPVVPGLIKPPVSERRS